MERLTERQKSILSGIHEIYRATGAPPTVRELGQRVGLSSSCTVQRHLDALERKGYIRRNRTKARSVEIIRSHDPAMVRRPSVSVPLVGQVAAGQPILAEENIEEVYALPADLVSGEGTFMLRVKGDSMIEAGLFDGDFVVVEKQSAAADGDVVVALLEDEATVKRFYRENGRIRLQPANSTMEPIYADADRVAIIGKVILGLRRF
ncbi:MAG TPA: transcriptional repressor LexA [Armatimonadota bacterium]|nr:transcriptional repressor LexA [Armatimonadota bacterium]